MHVRSPHGQRDTSVESSPPPQGPVALVVNPSIGLNAQAAASLEGIPIVTLGSGASPPVPGSIFDYTWLIGGWPLWDVDFAEAAAQGWRGRIMSGRASDQFPGDSIYHGMLSETVDSGFVAHVRTESTGHPMTSGLSFVWQQVPTNLIVRTYTSGDPMLRSTFNVSDGSGLRTVETIGMARKTVEGSDWIAFDLLNGFVFAENAANVEFLRRFLTTPI